MLLSAGASAASAQQRIGQTAAPAPGLGRFTGVATPVLTPGFKAKPIRVVRPDDMLILDVRLDNLAVQGKSLVRVTPGQDARLIVEHQPQAIADQAFQEVVAQDPNIQVSRNGTQAPPPIPPAKESIPIPGHVAESRMAGKSRLVFLMPAGQNSHAWGLEGLLDACRTWPMALDSTAQPLPVESYTLSDANKALGVMQVHLDHAMAVLKAKLPPDQQAALAQALPGASARISAEITASANRGQVISEGDIDQLIGRELDAAMGGPRAQTPNQRLLAGRLVEAASVSMAIAASSQMMQAGGSGSSSTTTTTTTTRRPAATTTTPSRVFTPVMAPPPPPNRAPAALAAPFVLPQQTPLRPSPGAAAAPPARTPAIVAPPPPARTPFNVAPQTPPAFQPTRPIQQLPPGVAANPPVYQTAPIVQLILKPHKPGDEVTALEIPYRLFQSPLATAGWSHALNAVTRGTRTEIWHTRLGTRKPSGVDDHSTEPLRAIWSWDYPDDAKQDPYDPPPPSWALNGDDRRMLVKLTAGYDETMPDNSKIIWDAPVLKAYTPKPSLAKRLMLTALGGWLDLEGEWDQRPTGVDLQAWSHKTAMARDYYVRVVYAGFLFPLGHAASLVKLTERKFESNTDGGREAVLRQRYFIVVRERVRSYPGTNQAFAGRDFPFKSVEIVTRVTPNLIPPGNDKSPPSPSNSDDLVAPAPGKPDFYGGKPDRWREAFFPNTGVPNQFGGDFLFQMVGVDGAGRRIPFSAPLFFLSELRNKAADIGDSATPGTIAYTYATKAFNGNKKSDVPMGGAVIQYAPQTVGGDAKGDTNIPTKTVTFHGAKPIGPIDIFQPQFYPSVAQAQVSLPAVQHLLGSEQPATVKLTKAFLDAGFGGSNRGQVFLDIVSPVSLPVDAGHPTNKFGGVISPNLAPTALSRSFGAVAGGSDPSLGNAGSFLKGSFTPSDFLPDDAMLLGAVKLKTVLNVIDVVSQPDQAPKFANLDLPDRIEAGFDLSQGNLKSPLPIFVPSDDSVLTISAKTIIYRDGTPAKSTVDASLNDFKINLFGFIILSFDNLTFHAEPSKKPDVIVDLNQDHGVVFGGPLEFVNVLKDYIPSNGFSDPPALSVTPTGISASYTLGLPDIGVGVLSLQNISLGAGFNLPFTGGRPSARFNFAERHNPFSLTVSMFGGGGFVAITVDSQGVCELEASLEFGASISIDLGVASGGVYIKGGFYYHWKDAPDNLIYFEGYVELGGHLSVLCLITASLTFHLGLAYENNNGHKKLFGQATLEVEIDILFFSFSVGVHVEKEFSSSNDPRFIDFIPDQGTWGQYCSAFA